MASPNLATSSVRTINYLSEDRLDTVINLADPARQADVSDLLASGDADNSTVPRMV